LDQKRRKLLPALAPWKREGLYLAGGTALALRLGHRTSLDFDFYSTEDFDPLRLAGKLSLPPGGFKISTQKPGTLLGRAGGVHLSAFHYPYRLLKPATETPSFLVASLEDIAAMKLIAVAQRGTRRDFTDLYFLCRLFDLEEVLSFAGKKYTSFDVYTGLRGLIYFEEAEREPPRPGVRLLKPAPWKDVKAFFLREVQSRSRR
jgi:hypothetical protein